MQAGDATRPNVMAGQPISDGAQPADEQEIALSAHALRVAYERDIEILRGVDFTGKAKSITAIIGPNGAGKSTLLRAIAGLAPVIGGRIMLGDRDITGLPPRRLLEFGLALVPQEGTVFGEMTVRENLQMGGWLRRRDKAWLEQRIQSVADAFRMSQSYLRKAAGDLSGGQQKMVEIARALILVPSILLLDEPTAGLAPAMADQIYQDITRLPKQLGVTIVLVDQNVRSALSLAEEAYVLAMGRNSAQGKATDILGRLDEIVHSWMAGSAAGGLPP